MYIDPSLCLREMGVKESPTQLQSCAVRNVMQQRLQIPSATTVLDVNLTRKIA